MKTWVMLLCAATVSLCANSAAQANSYTTHPTVKSVGMPVFNTATSQRVTGGMPILGTAKAPRRVASSTPVIMPTRQIAYKSRTLTHTVQSGETLYSIARKNCTTVANIHAVNTLSGSNIRTGMRLRLPSQSCR